MNYDKPLPEALCDDSLMCLCAFRYAIGRMTYVPRHVVEFLETHWELVDTNNRACILRDLEDEIERDDRDRAQNGKYFALGHDCDRETWVGFRDWIKAHG